MFCVRFVAQLFAISSLVVAQRVVTAGEIAPVDQTYGFGANDRCRLLAHSSVVLDYNNRHTLIIDGGFGSFLTTLDGQEVKVLDLNPYTVAFDLTKDFATPGLEPIWYHKKPSGPGGPPVTNHGGIWVSKDESAIWYQGGHYYNHSNWASSQYHVNKADIPPWQLWQINSADRDQGWRNVTGDIKGHEVADRTFAGAAVSVPKANKSFWIGGLLDSTTSATTPNNTFETTDQLLVFDHSTNELTRQKYFNSSSTEGHYQGDLVYLPIGNNSGYLMSLMSLKKPLNHSWPDPDGPDGNQESGEQVKLDTIPLYDIDTGEWFEQETSWFKDQVPEPRTRFCTALFHNEADNTWDLWVHGGQKLSDQNAGIPEIYVLSMPSFIWSKIQTTLADTNLIRSHTCHAVGSQLVIVGGYPTGLNVPTNASCDPEFIKVLNIEQSAVSWTGAFKTNTKYTSPQTIRDIVSSRTAPITGFANQKLENDFRVPPTPEPTDPPPPNHVPAGPIAGGVVGGLVAVVIVGVIIWKYRRSQQSKKREQEQQKLYTTNGARSPPPGQSWPEPVSGDGNVRENNQRMSMREQEAPVSPLYRTGTHELADPNLDKPYLRATETRL